MQTFQRLIEPVLRSFCFVYIHDVLAASSAEFEHLAPLECIFQRFFGISRPFGKVDNVQPHLDKVQAAKALEGT